MPICTRLWVTKCPLLSRRRNFRDEKVVCRDVSQKLSPHQMKYVAVKSHVKCGGCGSKSTYSLMVTLLALESRPSQSLCLNLFLFAIHFVPKHMSICKTAGNLLQLAVQWQHGICCSSNIAMNLLYPRHRLE